MAARLVLTLGGGVRVTSATEGPLRDLASLLTDTETEVRVTSPNPAGRGVIFGEVVVIYVAMKLLDELTDKALDAFIDRVITEAKTWARQRVQERVARGDQRVKSTHVELRNERGEQVGPSVAAEADANADVAVRVQPKPGFNFRRPVEFDPAWLEGRDGGGEEAEERGEPSR